MHHAPKYQSVPSTEVYQVPKYMAIYQVAKFNYRTFRTDLPNHKTLCPMHRYGARATFVDQSTIKPEVRHAYLFFKSVYSYCFF